MPTDVIISYILYLNIANVSLAQSVFACADPAKFSRKMGGGGLQKMIVFAGGKGTKTYCFIKLLCKFNKFYFQEIRPTLFPIPSISDPRMVLDECVNLNLS